MRVLYLAVLVAFALSACATTQTPDTPTDTASTDITASPALPPPAVSTDPTDDTPIEQVYEHKPPPALVPPHSPNPFHSLSFWMQSDPRPALTAFRRSCVVWSKRDLEKPVSKTLKVYGNFSDWWPACVKALNVPDDPLAAQQFFERQFLPVSLFPRNQEQGLLTGYYQPEIHVRRTADSIFSEPILAVPHKDKDKKKPRSELNSKSARVIGYGRPIDVFFLQIQGSGHVTFEDGQRFRAAYAGNNGYPYTSIGAVLVRRGAMTKQQASKQSIEDWMIRNGPKAARDLMNENKRYIFFKEQVIKQGEGPKGAMQVPLTAMGSLAVDPRYHPYGTPVWLTTHLPTRGGDYRGQQTGQLVIAQDTGKAIRGAMRGDLYFGSGFDAGERAGVMKHPATWTVLLPRELALALLRVS